MPWEIKKQDKQFCVFKEGEDSPIKNGCYDKEQDAKNRMAALYASEEDSNMKKSATNADTDVGDATAVGESGQDRDIAKNNSDSFEGDENHDPDPTSFKMHSFNHKIREVEDAWFEQNEYRGFVREVFPDHAVVRMGKEFFKVPYSKDDGGITFASNEQWQKVEMKQEWVDKSYAVKALGGNRVGGYLILFGDENSKDLHDEYFTEETEEVDKIFKGVGALPWIFHHGADETVKSEVHGIVDVLEKDDTGWWFEAKIKEQELYKKYVKPLIQSNKLFSSSGTLPGAKRAKKDGHIARWPVAEATGTHVPAEWRMLDRPIGEIKSAYKSVGIEADFEEFAEEDASGRGADAEGAEEARKMLEAQLYQDEAELELMELELSF